MSETTLYPSLLGLCAYSVGVCGTRSCTCARSESDMSCISCYWSCRRPLVMTHPPTGLSAATSGALQRHSTRTTVTCSSSGEHLQGPTKWGCCRAGQPWVRHPKASLCPPN
jgi:hypothetical protein